MANTSSLSKFAVRPPGLDAAQPQVNNRPTPTRGKNTRVGIAVRLSHEDWHRATEFAMREHTSLQRLLVAGLSELMKQRGLPPLDAD